MVIYGDVQEQLHARKKLAIDGIAEYLLLPAEPRAITQDALQRGGTRQRARLVVNVEKYVIAGRVAVPAPDLTVADAAGGNQAARVSC
jgi:hypothetical protein